jgi:tellurite methyltransferase
VPSDWSRFYDATGDDPRATLLEALRRFDDEGAGDRFAVDLGCGTGRDTAELLHRGWSVLAVDGNAEAIQRLEGRDDLSTADRSRLETRVSPFQDADWPAADLVNSSFALPFCPPGDFPAVWERIESSLRGGGRFSGQLFGDRDGWSDEEEMTFLSRADAEKLLEDFHVEQFDEVDEGGATATGKAKHWHLFHVVARRRQTEGQSPRTGGRYPGLRRARKSTSHATARRPIQTGVSST